MKENCELLSKAQALAIKRNLPAEEVYCPIIQTCRGTTCLFLPDLDQLELDLKNPTYLKNLRSYPDAKV